MDSETDYYEVLGLKKGCKETEIRRAYRNLLTKEHPDKGGDPDKFASIQRAYDVLSSDVKRKQYDSTGTVEKTPDEELLDSFGGGAFRDKMRQQQQEKESMAEQIAVRQAPEAQSHSAGFEAWMRSRGDSANKVFDKDDVIENYGVVKASYEAVELPPIRAYQIRCNEFGRPKDVLEVISEPIPNELEWGEVLVNIRAAPVNPSDLYQVQVATSMSNEAIQADCKPPFIAGNDGLGVVVKVGPGVKNLSENDWVFPFKPGMGTFRSLAVWKEKDILKMPVDLMPLEYAAMMRELCVAYRLLEDHGSLKPGDSVILNAANGTIGTIIIQLCRMLKLRVIALIRAGDPEYFEKTSKWLTSLGASEVLLDEGNLKSELDKKKFFARPKLALDAVGGASAVRLADALQEGCPLVIYGCMGGRNPTWPWQHWVFKGLQVQGFNLRSWMNTHKKRIPGMLETLAKLVNADKLVVNFTEYELSNEFDEALDHALEDSRNTKVLIKVTDVGTTY